MGLNQVLKLCWFSRLEIAFNREERKSGCIIVVKEIPRQIVNGNKGRIRRCVRIACVVAAGDEEIRLVSRLRRSYPRKSALTLPQSKTEFNSKGKRHEVSC